MQFSENWLRTLVDPGMSSDALSHLLTMAGLEVEDTPAVAPPFSNVVVAQVKTLEKHPYADRLRVCQVDVGDAAPLTIVCGAPNVYAGMKVVCARVGARLPARSGVEEEAFEIKLGKLRGVASHGMLCSARELGLPEESDGLLELASDAPIGQNFRDYYALDDLQFTVKLTPNRADCLSVLGVAREVSALTQTAMKPLAIAPVAPTCDEKLPVTIAAPELCGRFAGRVLRNINAKAATPFWMKQRLLRSGQRSISALVDITNYVMLELGQPSHVYDLDKISSGLTVRWGQAGESLKLLNDEVVALDDWVGVIATQGQSTSLAGIMGGDESAVTLETRNVYLEAAFWWPDAIQGRARRYKFSSEAAHRFERGVDFQATRNCLERLTALVLEICAIPGQTQVGPIDDQIARLPEAKRVSLRTARASKVIGMAISDEQIAAIFKGLGFEFTQAPGQFEVQAPSYRFDIEIEEDLIEEIARIIGYDNIPALPPVAANVLRGEDEATRSLFAIRRQLADLDYQEVINYSFVDADWEKDFCNNEQPIRVVNPISSQMSVMRSSLVASLVANVAYNIKRQQARVRVFETGLVFSRTPKSPAATLQIAGFTQTARIAAIAYGPAVEEQWGQKNRTVDFFDVKADLEALFAPRILRFEKGAHPALHAGRSAQVLLDGEVIGFMGELHPRWQQKYDLPLAPVVFEVDAEVLQQRGLPCYHEIAKFPAVVRDIALLADQTVAAQRVIDSFHALRASEAACAIFRDITLFDEYRGAGLQTHERSLAFRCTLQGQDATLQDAAVDAAMGQLLRTLEQKYSIKLRS